MRPVKACLQCRAGKRRCDRVGYSACNQCVHRNLQCSAAVALRESRPTLPRPPLLEQCHPDKEVLHLVDLYFQFMNDQPHSIFHEPTFKLSVVAGTVSQPVLFGMMGLSARYDVACRTCIFFLSFFLFGIHQNAYFLSYMNPLG